MMWKCMNCGWTGDKNFLEIKDGNLCCPSCKSTEVKEVEAGGLKWVGRQIVGKDIIR